MKPLAKVAAVLTTVLAGATGAFAPHAYAAPTRYEAEVAPAACDGTVDTNHSGFSGSGFCNSANASGAAVQFTVNAASAVRGYVRSAQTRRPRNRSPELPMARQREFTS